MDKYLNTVIGDRYEIREIIGIGGMAVVYKAYDRVDDRVVAVKVLKDEYKANEEFRMRFKNESKAISMLSHPNIVKVLDVNFGEDVQYIVMEYVEGITLKEYIERQKVLDVREAEHFVVQILRALQHAHDKGIVHRDIKPQNIILLPNANIKVTDFGIARFNHMDTRNVDESSAIGSVHYVSPEQAKGEFTDGRSDIYSVGVVLYEMLTGQVPFEAESDSSVALMQLQEEAKRPSLLNPKIPVGLEQITMRALQKDPADRYQTAAEFLSDLYEFKHNPQIKFDYTYFVDSDPTKPIDPPTPKLTTADIPVRGSAEDESIEESVDDDELDDDDYEEKERNVTVPVLIGITIALILVIGVILAFAFGDSIFNGNSNPSGEPTQSFWQKLDFFGWFSGDKIEVPNFLNMDFDEVLEKYPNLAIDPVPQRVYNTTYEAGKVIEQDPEAGEKVSPDTVIKLSVATNNSTVAVPDVTGYDYKEAENILKAKGFTVECFQAYDDSKDADTVVYTDPKAESYAAYGSTVYVYYASEKAEMEDVRVPSVVGDQESVARQKILAAGLKVNATTSDSSSPALKGYVIGQNPVAGTNVKSGSYVNLVIGNGVQESSTASFQITLPNLGGKKATIRTYLNDTAYDTFTDVVLDGSTLSVSYTGTGEENEFTVFVDNSKYLSGQIDFTKSSGKVHDVYRFPIASRETLPNVVGKSESEAKKILSDAGFTNVSVETTVRLDMPKGVVISQSPVSSDLTQFTTNTAIKLVVSAGAEERTEPTNTTEPVHTDPTNPTSPGNDPTDQQENTTSSEVPSEENTEHGGEN